MNDELSSKTAKEGDTFRLSLAEDIHFGNFIVIPRGTPASGEVTWRTGKGAFGKSAKMEIEMRHLHLYGRRIPISASTARRARATRPRRSEQSSPRAF
jgi:hypothetical protein